MPWFSSINIHQCCLCGLIGMRRSPQNEHLRKWGVDCMGKCNAEPRLSGVIPRDFGSDGYLPESSPVNAHQDTVEILNIASLIQVRRLFFRICPVVFISLCYLPPKFPYMVI